MTIMAMVLEKTITETIVSDTNIISFSNELLE